MTMTTVNDIADILRIIREQPEWADALRAALLSQELLEMPQKLTQLTAAFTEFMETSNKRFATLEGDVAELKTGQARLEAGQARLEGWVGNLRGNSYEQKVGNTISSILTERMNRRVRFLKRTTCPTIRNSSTFCTMLKVEVSSVNRNATRLPRRTSFSKNADAQTPILCS